MDYAGSSGDSNIHPLMFELDLDDKEHVPSSSSVTEHVVQCMVCPEVFQDSKSFCHHMVLEHKILIADSKLIAHLQTYADYWRQRFTEMSYKDVCKKILIGSKQQNKDDLSDEHVYVLGGDNEDDRALREKLRRARLEVVLSQHARERKDTTFHRTCVFCKKPFLGNRSILFKHMMTDHNFSVGKPDNIVFVNEFLDLLEEKVDKNIECLFCEKRFKDKATLKEHMRKKLHKKINPKNKEFDKFFSINYLEVGMSWEEVSAQDDSEILETEEEFEELWGGWHDNCLDCVCLFCELRFPDFDTITSHMTEVHKFNLIAIRNRHRMNYYQQVKFINYIRKQMLQLSCFNCCMRFGTHDTLLEHLMTDKHVTFFPNQSMWDQPQYYFPTYENDNLLSVLECEAAFELLSDQSVPAHSGDASSQVSTVVSEDMVVIPEDSILWNEELRNQLFRM